MTNYSNNAHIIFMERNSNRLEMLVWCTFGYAYALASGQDSGSGPRGGIGSFLCSWSVVLRYIEAISEVRAPHGREGWRQVVTALSVLSIPSTFGCFVGVRKVSIGWQTSCRHLPIHLDLLLSLTIIIICSLKFIALLY
jgi:hypothetical protein